MKPYQCAILVILLASCSPEKPNQEAKVLSTEQLLVKPVTDSTAIDPIPGNAIQETFEDKPGLVRVIVNDGTAIAQQGNYFNGKREGIWVEFYPNGLVKNATSYLNGAMEGLRVEMDANGQLTKRLFFHNNLRHGEYKEFNYATVIQQRTYKNGKLEGLVKVFYSNGKLMEDGMYQNGLREGISQWYDQNGNLTITYEYKKGELVKK